MPGCRFQDSKIGLAALMLLAAGQGSAQGADAPASVAAVSRLRDSARSVLATAVPEGDLARIRAARALLERALTAQPNDAWLLHYSGYALYREAVLVMARDSGAYKPLLERADELLERSAAASPIAETHALRASVLGMMIGSNPLRGMTLGPKSGAQMERALELGPRNPRVWLLRGIGAFNTPAMFGGGLDKAREYLDRSVELFREDAPESPAPSWGANEAHAWLGQSYAREGNKDAARAEYQRALAIAPNDNWVKYGLLPALDRAK